MDGEAMLCKCLVCFCIQSPYVPRKHAIRNVSSKEKIEWSLPETETTPCYWLTNDWEEDKSRKPAYLWSSLQRLRLDLEQRSRPTPQKMRKEQDMREDNNDRVVAELQKCADFWNTFSGPPLEHLRRPTAAIMEAAQETVAAQKEFVFEQILRRLFTEVDLSLASD